VISQMQKGIDARYICLHLNGEDFSGTNCQCDAGRNAGSPTFSMQPWQQLHNVA
jgi:hypothetical protein